MGAVMMKMISSTSITSTKGVTLMSAIGPALFPLLKAITGSVYSLLGLEDFVTGSAHARAGGEEIVQVVGERVELGNDSVVHLREEVEREHGRDRDEQTDGGHDQCFTHRAGNGVDRGRTGCTDLDQRAVDAPHGTQQAHERSSRADGSQP